MKKTVITVTALVLFCVLCGFTPRLSEMFDEADLFTADEEERLSREAEQLAEQAKTEIVFLTYDDAEGKDTEQYTDDFCDDREFGYGGEEKSFMMLAIDMDNREVYVKTGGTAIARVTDREIEYILDEIFVWMPEGDYNRAQRHFLRRRGKRWRRIYFLMLLPMGNTGMTQMKGGRSKTAPDQRKEKSLPQCQSQLQHQIFSSVF